MMTKLERESRRIFRDIYIYRIIILYIYIYRRKESLFSVLSKSVDSSRMFAFIVSKKDFFLWKNETDGITDREGRERLTVG